MVNIVYLSKHRFNKELQEKIKCSNNFTENESISSVAKRCRKSKSINIICLDHTAHYRHHKVGIENTRVLRKIGCRSVCIQHGSTRDDNVLGHLSVTSEYQVVYGNYLYMKLCNKTDIKESRVYKTGNPIHDSFITMDKKVIMDKLFCYLNKEPMVREKKIILLATCLHSEYDDKNLANELYRTYIRKIYEGVEGSGLFLIVKMHPNDSICPNIYREEVIDNENILIITPDNDDFTVYELCTIADLIITRGSTVAEEALLLKKNVLAFDLYSDGPANSLPLLKESKNFRVVIDFDEDLKEAINEMIDLPFHVNGKHNRIVEEIAFKLDGRSTERVIKAFLEIASKCTSPAIL
jgi:UDP-N-acetylglucosamine 2-epimerase